MADSQTVKPIPHTVTNTRSEEKKKFASQTHFGEVSQILGAFLLFLSGGFSAFCFSIRSRSIESCHSTYKTVWILRKRRKIN
ncbi:hypothetical protein RJT34_13593 [Clitoria ternatea]|uniref:Uncharacterized protein n=1 Tax=Clitoria ternatea TaxID=43366 RepID=A0AAN9JP77_CLITE